MYTRSIYYYETDRMGIVHNSNYLRIFEEARLHYMKDIGADYPQMEADGILIPQTEGYVKYISPLCYGDDISVDVRLTEFNGIVMKYEYSVYANGADTPSTCGFTCHCFVDDHTRLPVNLKKKMPVVFEALRAHRA